MTQIRLSITIDRPPAAVWAELRDIASHVHWMEDAEQITFTSPTREGVGTSFDCISKLGPLKVTDKMLVTEWTEGESITVRHEGMVTGVGRFLIEPQGPDKTKFTWDENLTFPAKMGGQAGAAAATPLFKRVWRKNLENLKRRVEAAPTR